MEHKKRNILFSIFVVVWLCVGILYIFVAPKTKQQEADVPNSISNLMNESAMPDMLRDCTYLIATQTNSNINLETGEMNEISSDTFYFNLVGDTYIKYGSSKDQSYSQKQFKDRYGISYSECDSISDIEKAILNLDSIRTYQVSNVEESKISESQLCYTFQCNELRDSYKDDYNVSDASFEYTTCNGLPYTFVSKLYLKDGTEKIIRTQFRYERFCECGDDGTSTDTTTSSCCGNDCEMTDTTPCAACGGVGECKPDCTGKCCTGGDGQ